MSKDKKPHNSKFLVQYSLFNTQFKYCQKGEANHHEQREIHGNKIRFN